MTRYVIQGEWRETVPTQETIDIINPTIDNTHMYRNTYTFKGPHGPHYYNQDKCLNRYDLNYSIFDKIVETEMFSKLWTIDPEYLTLELALLIAEQGKGEYLSERYKKLWEITVLRYASGERNFAINTPDKDEKRLREEAEEASLDLDGYMFDILEGYSGYIKKDKENYQIEEERALNSELERLSVKEDFCMDLMTDVILVKRRVVDAMDANRKNK